MKKPAGFVKKIVDSVFRQEFSEETRSEEISDSEITYENGQGTPDDGETDYSRYVLKGCVISDIGCYRENNEDNFLFDMSINEGSEDQIALLSGRVSSAGEWRCSAVFDGMGGGEKGELASLMAAQELRSAFGELKGEVSGEDVDAAVRQGFLAANRRVIREKERNGMYGTTGTVFCTDGRVFKIWHLGDSRAYLLRGGDLYQLTRDQTLAAMKIEAGFYDENDPQAEQEKHKLTEYIGCDMTGENLTPLESQWIRCKDGDRILLCSDGLYDVCSDNILCDMMKDSEDPRRIAESLTGYALSCGGPDNITSIILTLKTEQS